MNPKRFTVLKNKEIKEKEKKKIGHVRYKGVHLMAKDGTTTNKMKHDSI